MGRGGPLSVQREGQSVWGGEQSIPFPGRLGSFWSSVPCIEFLSSGRKTPLMLGCSTAGEKPESSPGPDREDLLDEGAFFPIFFHQEDVEVNTCHGRAGKDRGMIPVQGEQGTALNQGQSYRNPFSAVIPPFCHIPRGSATSLG